MIWHSWTSLKMALQKKGEREKMMTLLLSWLSNFNFALIISYFIILSHFRIMVPSYPPLSSLRSIFFFWYLFVTVRRISFPLAHIKRIDGTIQQIKVTVTGSSSSVSKRKILLILFIWINALSIYEIWFFISRSYILS